MSDRFFALRLFARIAHTGSFSRAGRELGLSQPSASRIAAELERDVGAALLTRTTRGVTLTEAGADYLARIEPLLTALEEADHAARGTGELRGMLRVALSIGFGMREVIPRLPAFMQRHPALRIDLLMRRPRPRSPRRECRRRASLGRTDGFERHRPSPGSLASLGRRLAGLPGTGRVTGHAGRPCEP